MAKIFSTSAQRLFNNKKARKTLLKLRTPIGLLLFVLTLSQLNREWFFPGLFVSVVGQALQVWCLATIKTMKNLTVAGPYMFVRNPMYLGRFFLVFGILMMTGNPWLLILFTVFYYFYMVNRVKREKRILLGLFGKEYKNYCRDIHPYLPGLKRFDSSRLHSFNRESFHRNNAFTNIAVPITSYVTLYLFTFPYPL